MALADLMKSLEGVTLEEVDRELAEVQQEMNTVLEPLKKRQDLLLQLKRLMSPKPAPVARQSKRSAARSEDSSTDQSKPSATARSRGLAEEIHAYLTAAGPMKVQAIANQIEREYQSVYQCVSSRPDLFRKTAPGEFGVA